MTEADELGADSTVETDLGGVEEAFRGGEGVFRRFGEGGGMLPEPCESVERYRDE